MGSLTPVRQTLDREVRARQMDNGDEDIDALVYELYGLTEEEIGIVEEATK